MGKRQLHRRTLYWQGVTDQHTTLPTVPIPTPPPTLHRALRQHQARPRTTAAPLPPTKKPPRLWGKCTTVATNNANIGMKHCMGKSPSPSPQGTSYSSCRHRQGRTALLRRLRPQRHVESGRRQSNTQRLMMPLPPTLQHLYHLHHHLRPQRCRCHHLPRHRAAGSGIHQ